MSKIEQTVIIGSGPAGLTAALYAARANMEPVVYEGIQPGGQLTTTTDVENFPGFPEAISGVELIDLMHKQAERFGTRFVMDEITGGDFSKPPFSLKTGGGDTITARSVIIATGAAARYLGIESEQKLLGKGVSGCATCDGAFFRDQDVAVVGGGDTAMEDALFLTRLCRSVTIIHRRDAFRASKIMAERALKHPKIKVIWNSVVEEVLDVSAGEVTGLRLRSTKDDSLSEIAVSGLFLAIGHTPNTAPFAGQIKCNAAGFIIADHTRTSVPGVFAAGDVQDPTYKQAVTAAGSGCEAALNVERYLEQEA